MAKLHWRYKVRVPAASRTLHAPDPLTELPARLTAVAPMAVAASLDVSLTPAAPTTAAALPSVPMTVLPASPEISSTAAVPTTITSGSAATVAFPASPEVGLTPTAPATVAFPPAEVDLAPTASHPSVQPPFEAGPIAAAMSAGPITAATSASTGTLLPRIPTPDEVRTRYVETPSSVSKAWFVVTRGRLPGVYPTWYVHILRFGN